MSTCRFVQSPPFGTTTKLLPFSRSSTVGGTASARRVIYVGDGSSDVHVMLHVNNRGGFTIAVSENNQLARIAKRTVLSDNAVSILLPVLDQVLGWEPREIRALLESNGLLLDMWEKLRTDRVVVSDTSLTAGNTIA